jgi:hypothetical protein
MKSLRVFLCLGKKRIPLNDEMNKADSDSPSTHARHFECGIESREDEAERQHKREEGGNVEMRTYAQKEGCEPKKVKYETSEEQISRSSIFGEKPISNRKVETKFEEKRGRSKMKGTCSRGSTKQKRRNERGGGEVEVISNQKRKEK